MEIGRIERVVAENAAFLLRSWNEYYNALNSLPPVELKYSAESELKGGDGITRVTVENPSRNLAFAVHLMVKTVKRDEEDVREEAEILPVLDGRRFLAGIGRLVSGGDGAFLAGHQWEVVVFPLGFGHLVGHRRKRARSY